MYTNDLEDDETIIKYLCEFSISSKQHYLFFFDCRAGAQDLRAPDDRMYRPLHPSIVETLPDDFPDLKHEFSKLESQMFDRSNQYTHNLVPCL